MAPDRGTNDHPRPRTLSFNLPATLLHHPAHPGPHSVKSRSSSARTSSSKRSRVVHSSEEESSDGDRGVEGLGGRLRYSPEDLQQPATAPLASTSALSSPRRIAPRPKRSLPQLNGSYPPIAVPRSSSSAAVVEGVSRPARPYTPSRAATLEPDWRSGGSSPRQRSTSLVTAKRRRHRAKSLHTPPLDEEGSSTHYFDQRHLTRGESASTPAPLSLPAHDLSSDEPRPASPFLTIDARRRSKTVTSDHRTPRPRPLSQVILSTSGTSSSLADIATGSPDQPRSNRFASFDHESTPRSANEPTLKQLIDGVKLDDALKIYQSIQQKPEADGSTRGPSIDRAMSPPLSMGNGSLDSGKQPLLKTSTPNKGDRRISISLGMGKGKKMRDALGSLSAPSTPEKSRLQSSTFYEDRRYDEDVRRAQARMHPQSYARADMARNYFETRYRPVLEAVGPLRHDGQHPPNVVAVAHWRERMEEDARNALRTSMKGGSSKRESIGPTSSISDHPSTTIDTLPGLGPVQHRTAKQMLWEIYPDNIVAYLKYRDAHGNDGVPFPQSNGHADPASDLDASMAALPAPSQRVSDISATSNVYSSGAISSLRSSVASLDPLKSPNPRNSQASNTQAAPPPLSAQPPRSPLHGSHQRHQPRTSNGSSIKRNLSRVFRQRDYGASPSMSGYVTSGSERNLARSPAMSETDLTDGETGRPGSAKIRKRHSMADGGQISATGRRSQFRWPMSGAGGEGLQRIVSQVSNGSSAELNTNDPPTLGEMDGMIEDNKSASFDDDAPQPESEPVKPNETTVEEGFPDLEMAQMDPSQMDETDHLLRTASGAIGRATMFVKAGPERTNLYLAHLEALDMKSRTVTRILNQPPFQLPDLPRSLAADVKRYSLEHPVSPLPAALTSSEAFLHSRDWTADSKVTNNLVDDDDVNDASFASSAHTPDPASSNPSTLHARVQVKRRKSTSAFDMQPSSTAGSARPRQRTRGLTLATTTPKPHLAGMHPDPLPKLAEALEAFERLVDEQGQAVATVRSDLGVLLGKQKEADAKAEGILKDNGGISSTLQALTDRLRNDSKQTGFFDPFWAAFLKAFYAVAALFTASVLWAVSGIYSFFSIVSAIVRRPLAMALLILTLALVYSSTDQLTDFFHSLRLYLK